MSEKPTSSKRLARRNEAARDADTLSMNLRIGPRKTLGRIEIITCTKKCVHTAETNDNNQAGRSSPEDPAPLIVSLRFGRVVYPRFPPNCRNHLVQSRRGQATLPDLRGCFSCECVQPIRLIFQLKAGPLNVTIDTEFPGTVPCACIRVSPPCRPGQGFAFSLQYEPASCRYSPKTVF